MWWLEGFRLGRIQGGGLRRGEFGAGAVWGTGGTGIADRSPENPPRGHGPRLRGNVEEIGPWEFKRCNITDHGGTLQTVDANKPLRVVVQRVPTESSERC